MERKDGVHKVQPYSRTAEKPIFLMCCSVGQKNQSLTRYSGQVLLRNAIICALNPPAPHVPLSPKGCPQENVVLQAKNANLAEDGSMRAICAIQQR